MYILDAYHGLFLLDLQSAAATHLVSPHTAIDTLSDAASPLPPMFFNDLDLWGDEVVFSDSSYKFTRSENRRCLYVHVCMNMYEKYTYATCFSFSMYEYCGARRVSNILQVD